jgi:hypothetical protein
VVILHPQASVLRCSDVVAFPVVAFVEEGWSRLGTLLVGASMLLRVLLGSFAVVGRVVVVPACCP